MYDTFAGITSLMTMSFSAASILLLNKETANVRNMYRHCLIGKYICAMLLWGLQCTNIFIFYKKIKLFYYNLCSEYFKNKVNEKLQLSLLNDLEFWQGKEFSVTSFLNHIYKNSIFLCFFL